MSRQHIRFAAVLAAGALATRRRAATTTRQCRTPAAEPAYTPAPASDCNTDPATLLSEPADGTVESGSTVARIREEGVLKVGVSADTFLMAARNTQTNRIQGFDIEVVKAIGEAIFGPDFNLNTDVQLRVITAADRIPLLGGEDAEGDLTRSSSTSWSETSPSTPAARSRSTFSAVYYQATQKVLVRGRRSGVLHRPRVTCGQEGVCSERVDEPGEHRARTARRRSSSRRPITPGASSSSSGTRSTPSPATTRSWPVLPPRTRMPSCPRIRPILSLEPYGVGLPKGDSDFVAFVNFALEEMVGCGRLAA